MKTRAEFACNHAATLFLVLSLPLAFISAPAHAFAPPAIDANNEGVHQYQKQDYPGAFNSFAGALARDPFNPDYHFNLGDAFFKNGDIPKALSEYDAVDQNPRASKDLKYKAMFNAGNAAIEAKNIPTALNYYQRALQYDPDSLEVKTNIELALKEQQKQGGGGKQDQKQNQNDQNKDQNKNQNDKQQQNDKKNQDKNQQNQNQNQNQQKNPPNQNQPQPTPRPTAQPFKSQALNENDVRRILEELKRQEEQIRARQYDENHNHPETQVEKDW